MRLFAKFCWCGCRDADGRIGEVGLLPLSEPRAELLGDVMPTGLNLFERFECDIEACIPLCEESEQKEGQPVSLRRI